MAAAAVQSSLNFWLDPALGGHTHYTTGTAAYYRHRRFDEHQVKINDARGREQDFSLETHGFQHAKHVSSEKEYTDDSRVKSVVYPETEELIKKITGATRVHTFSHIIRRSSREKVQAAVDNDKSLSDDAVVNAVAPARFIHIDFSNDGAVEILKDNFPPEEAAKLQSCRWSIINVWRPIKPVRKDPLALCDSRTVRDEDLKTVSVTLPSKGTGQYSNVSKGEGFELYYLRYSPEQEWYYVSAMTPEEVLLLKCYDSIKDGKTARRVPHSSFTAPETKDDVNRESLEVRSLVFFEDQPI